MKKLLTCLLLSLTAISIIAVPTIINIGGKIISISPPSDLPFLYNIPSNAIVTVTVPGQTNYQVSYWQLVTNIINSVNTNSSGTVAASNVFSGGVLRTGILNSGTTNLPGNLEVTGVDGLGHTNRYITQNAGNLTNVNANNTILVGGTIIKTNIFNVKQYGAFGDGHFAGGVSTTNISGICHLGASSANFSALDIGDQIQVICGNTNAQSWFSTIVSVISPTVCTLSTVPNILYTNFYFCIYGQHDDSSAIQSAINAAWIYGGGDIYIPAGVYLIETNFVNTNQNNTQLIIPYFSGANGGSPQVAIYGDNSFRIWSVSNDNFAPSSNQTSLVEMRTGNNNASTNFFASSLIDGRAYNGIAPTAGADMNNSFTTYRGNNCVLAVHDLGIWIPYNSGICALSLIPFNDSIPDGGVWNVEISGVVGPSNGDAFSTNAPNLSTNSIGIIAPGSFSGLYGRIDDTYVGGFYDGIESGLINSKRTTINDCFNCINTRLQPNVVADFYDLNISDSSNIVVAGVRAGGNSIRVHNYSAIQATQVGESGWWTIANQINAVYDPNGLFNTAYCEMNLPYTNGGMPIVINEPNTSGTAKGTKGFFWSVESAPGNSRAYATSSKVVNSPMDFNSQYAESSGAGGGWDYTFSDLLVNSNLSVAGNLSVTGTITANFAIPIETQVFYQSTNSITFTGGPGNVYQTSIFNMQNNGDYSEATGGTRGSKYWLWGFQDNAGSPFDGFPAVDVVFTPQNPGVANAVSGYNGTGITFGLTTNGSALVWSNLYVSGSAWVSNDLHVVGTLFPYGASFYGITNTPVFQGNGNNSSVAFKLDRTGGDSGWTVNMAVNGQTSFQMGMTPYGALGNQPGNSWDGGADLYWQPQIPSVGPQEPWTLGLMTNGAVQVYSNMYIGGWIAPSNTIAAGSVINTNWILGAKYSFPYPMMVSGMSVLTPASVAGVCSLAIEVPGNITNYSAVQTLIGTLAMPTTNAIPMTFVPANTTFDFTNRSSGAGDSATVSGGQYMIF